MFLYPEEKCNRYRSAFLPPPRNLPTAVREANGRGSAKVEGAWPVNEPAKGTKETEAYELTRERMAHAVYMAAVCDLRADISRTLPGWIVEKDLTICGPIREVYPTIPVLYRQKK